MIKAVKSVITAGFVAAWSAGCRLMKPGGAHGNTQEQHYLSVSENFSV